MAQKRFKILTLFTAIFCTWILFSSANAQESVVQEKLKSHLRWNIYAPVESLSIKKREGRVLLKSLNQTIFNQIAKSALKIKALPPYISSITIKEPSQKDNLPAVEIKLATNNIDIFNFYRETQGKYILDFWIDEDSSKKFSTISKKTSNDKVSVKKAKKKTPVISKNKSPKKKIKKKAVKTNPVQLGYMGPPKFTHNSSFRDFRYGASFIWDYPAMKPILKNKLNLERKTPEFYFPITDRKYQDDERESHMQLSINLYRRKKFGLMYKSITLYTDKYGEDSNFELNEYLKANALLRENLENGNRHPVKTALNIFSTISRKSKNYEMQKGILKYLIHYSVQKEEFVKSLERSKRFYVLSKENFDYEESQFAAEVILFSLARLNQNEKLRDLLNEKTIQKLIPKQISLAYEIFVNLNLGDSKKVISLYEKNKKSLMRPVHQLILFNTAEAYFREGKFKKSIKLFDEFLADYSFNTRAAQARLRIALSYEILDKDIKQTLSLYKNAMNRSQDFMTRYEAQIRYVGLNSVRRKILKSDHLETRVFLKNDQRKEVENKSLLKLLWLVRLRTFIADKEFSKALTYLKSLPINSMKPSEVRVLEADGAEIISGLIFEKYNDAAFPDVVKIWEIYKDKYVKNVALDPKVNYVVAKSYVRLGLFSGFDSVFESFSKNKNAPTKNYPIWVKRKADLPVSGLLTELQIIRNIKLENWNAVNNQIEKLKKYKSGKWKYHYYKGFTAHKTKNYKSAVKHIETFFSRDQKDYDVDQGDLANLLHAYTDSIYQLGDTKKYKKIARAVLADVKSIKKPNEYMKKIKERIYYLLIEVLAGEDKKENYMLLENEIITFKKNYKGTNYGGRLNYLLGVSKISNKKIDEGKKILNSILSDEKVSDYIKELARSELSYLKLKNKTI